MSRRLWHGAVGALGGCFVLVSCGVEPLALQPEGVGSSREGVLVVSTDYKSTSVGAISNTGEILSQHVISSGSAPTGLSAALSGDVVVPASPQGRELVLLDRTTAVVTWVDLKTARVRAQLSVATGFASNPHDYLGLTEHKAYVTRYLPNLDPGDELYDSGHDVLVIDPLEPAITGHIDLMPTVQGEAAGLYPRPERAVLWGGLVRVAVLVFDPSYHRRADSRLVSIDPQTDQIVDIRRISGLTSCTGLALSPKGDEMALACNGALDGSTGGDFSDSGIVRFRREASGLQEVGRFSAAQLGGDQVSAVSYTSARAVLFTSYGRFSPDLHAAAQDSLRWLDLETGDLSAPLAQTHRIPFSFGDVLCNLSAGTCLMADAESDGGVVQRFDILNSGEVRHAESISIDGAVGLPPRYLGQFSW